MSPRTVHLRIQTEPDRCDPLFSFLRNAIPFYEAPGGVRIRLLRNVEDPTRFIEVVEYDSVEAFEKDEERLRHDDRMRGYLQTWRSLLSGAVEVETYEDVTHQL